MEAAVKLQILAEALISHSRAADRGEFEDVAAVVSIVVAVAKRQTTLVSILIRAIDDATYATADLETELQNA